METQVKRVEMVVKFWNHSKALLDPADPAERYVKAEMDAVMAMHQYGTPALEQRNIFVTSRDGNIRIAFHYYNTLDDIDALVESMKQLPSLIVRR